jgi:hypothetical protein
MSEIEVNKLHIDMGAWLYPEDATPGECIALDVSRFIEREGDKKAKTADSLGFEAVVGEFYRSCTARQAIEIVRMQLAARHGCSVLAAANGDGWCALLVVVDGQNVGVILPRFT